MFKKLGFLVSLSAFTAVGVHAQEPGEFVVVRDTTRTVGRKGTTTTVAKPLATVVFQGNHDFYLTVGNKPNSEKVLKDKPIEIKLAVAQYTLTFEEADSTGEIIQRPFTVNSEMTKRKDLVKVTFKNNYLDIIQSDATETVKSNNPHATLQEQASNDKAIAAELEADMVLKTGGSFTTRSGQNDQTLQTVTVRSLRVGCHEVTQRQWQAVTGNNNSVNKGCNDCPVESVSWNEVMSFIDRLNKLTPKKFRLPTETEWAYVEDRSIAAEAGPSTDLAVINQLRKKIVETSAWHDEKGSHPVGQKKPVGGLYDLFGNVAEWCAGEGDKKAIRGGSYKDKEESLRLSPRAAAAPTDKQRTVGFRLVMDAD